MHRLYPNAPQWAFPVLLLLALANLVCAIALLKWKKWGFWGFCLTSVFTALINYVIQVGLFATFLGFSGIVILYGVLRIGKDEKGWPQLE